MSTSHPVCPSCGSSMNAGVTIDATHRDALGTEAAFQSQWVMIPADEIEKGRWIGALQNLQGRERRDILTYCCQDCGCLQSFAHPRS
ncbi:MAG: hypothetical protein QF363_03785 [Planctomycetaceae bacterium]|nr:hypothetical protein [Planctomycetaceae bacterium]